MTRVTPPDLELWLTSYLRDVLTREGWDVEVDSKEPRGLRTPLSRPLVVIRDDSGQRVSVVSYRRQVGISVLAGTRSDDALARRLALAVYAVATDDAIALAAGSPVAAVTDSMGPYAVDDDHDVARRYLSAEYVVVGTW